MHPLVLGGGQESGLRAGTQDVPAISGLGLAAKLAESEREASVANMSELTELLSSEIEGRGLGSVIRPGAPTQPLLPNILSFIVDGPPAEVFLHHLDARGVMASAGSACQSNKRSMNPALFAIGLSEDEARRILRLSIGKRSSREEVLRGVEVLEEVRDELARHV